MMNKSLSKETDLIENIILNIRGLQVILDKDLAYLYNTDTRTLKQSVKRNIEKFPIDFMFELREEEINNLVSQNVIPSRSFIGGARPFAFTEQGIAMLASVLKSTKAVDISIKIIRAFVAMRKTIAITGNLIHRVDVVEKKLLQTDEKFEKVFTALEKKDHLPAHGIFFNGQIFDAHKFISDIIRKAKKNIILIDNYIDDNTLQAFSKRRRGLPLTIFTQKITQQISIDVEKFNLQYGPVLIKTLPNNLDRFLIIDEEEMYHIGASLKDLGKKMFGFSKMDTQTVVMLTKLKEIE